MTIAEFSNTHNIKCNYIKYFGLVNSVSKGYKNQLTAPVPTRDLQLLRQLKNAKKATSFAYELLNHANQVVPTAQHKWEVECNKNVLGKTDIDWTYIYTMPYKCTLDTKTRYMQFRFIHRILHTNDFLYKIGIVENDECTFCNKDTEVMKHLMWSCKVVSTFLEMFLEWLICLNVNVHITYYEVCFGFSNQILSSFPNMIILLAKRFIYRCRVQNQNPAFPNFKKFVFDIEKFEKIIAQKNR
jgi:hypothetical protein